MDIIYIFFLYIILILIGSGILLLLCKLFKINDSTYNKSLILCLVSTITAAIIGLVVGLLSTSDSLIGSLIIFVFPLLVFYLLFRKLYSVKISSFKIIVVYLLFTVITMLLASPLNAIVLSLVR